MRDKRTSTSLGPGTSLPAGSCEATPEASAGSFPTRSQAVVLAWAAGLAGSGLDSVSHFVSPWGWLSVEPQVGIVYRLALPT